eukprot:m.56926 g.56926  ORF g.56926 m.56926 type:complete len:103 (-) comp48984_c0_seq1:411-719(-)
MPFQVGQQALLVCLQQLHQALCRGLEDVKQISAEDFNAGKLRNLFDLKDINYIRADFASTKELQRQGEFPKADEDIHHHRRLTSLGHFFKSCNRPVALNSLL